MITIINYGLGNLGSLQNMYKRIGVPTKITSDIDEIEQAKKILLPGVGSFDAAIQRIDLLNLRAVLTYKAKEQKIPFLGICLGMQLAVIEFARHVANIANANSTEFDIDTNSPVVALITEWLDREGKIEKRAADSDLGGTMRLGSQKCPVKPNTLAYSIYGSEVNERHRHRYEVNNIYAPKLEKAGLIISARTPNEDLPEMMELPKAMHPWFFGVQFHPEFTSTPRAGHPLFLAYIRAALARQNTKTAVAA